MYECSKILPNNNNVMFLQLMMMGVRMTQTSGVVNVDGGVEDEEDQQN